MAYCSHQQAWAIPAATRDGTFPSMPTCGNRTRNNSRRTFSSSVSGTASVKLRGRASTRRLQPRRRCIGRRCTTRDPIGCPSLRRALGAISPRPPRPCQCRGRRWVHTCRTRRPTLLRSEPKCGTDSSDSCAGTEHGTRRGWSSPRRLCRKRSFAVLPSRSTL